MRAWIMRWFWVGWCVTFLSFRVAEVMEGSATEFTWIMIVAWTILLVVNLTLSIMRQVRAERAKQVTRDPKG